MNDLRFIPHMHAVKSMNGAFVNFKIDVSKTGVCLQVIHILPALLRCAANGAVQAFICHNNTTAKAKASAELQVLSGKKLSIRDGCITIVKQDVIGILHSGRKFTE